MSLGPANFLAETDNCPCKPAHFGYCEKVNSRAFHSRIKWLFSCVLCFVAILLPYRPRVAYIQGLSFLIHLPFKLFGKLGQFLLGKLNIVPKSDFSIDSTVDPSALNIEFQSNSRKTAVVLFSGGTDSTCATALIAEHFREIHLLTFYEHGTRFSPVPTKNVEILQAKFSQTQFICRVFSVDRLLRFFSYQDYFRHIRRHGRLVLATCGYSSLSWHVRTIAYCLENNISVVADGLTRELMHLPGHMDETITQIREFYKSYGIEYINPVRDWPVPEDQQFIDRLILNRHASDFFLGDQHTAQRKTTGRYLFEKGIFPSPNVKGSRLDFLMQHDCYPFALYNIIAFWGYLSLEPYAVFCQRIANLMIDKISVANQLLRDFQRQPQNSILRELIEIK